jgi:hypothetical protein
MKKSTATLKKKLSLTVETVAALERSGLEKAQGGHYSIPAFFTCPECAPQ